MRTKGFTLVEVALTVVLASVIALAIYATLSYGLKIAQRVQGRMAEEDAAFFFTQMTEEFQNSFPYATLKFSGNPFSVAFPTIVSDKRLLPQAGRGPGMVRYLFDEKRGLVERAPSSYSNVYKNDVPEARPVISGVETLEFAYYFFNQEKGEYLWSGTWPPQEGTSLSPDFPLAVRVTLIFKEKERFYEYHQTIPLPMAAS
jgi:prepilin-type N-terminal cleavage/methylation domain-containing protein